MPLLEINNLKTGYGAIEILRGVTLEVNEGEIVALLGSNGAGKTTLNLALSGILPITNGDISFDNNSLKGKSSSDIVASGLIHVPEGRKIFPNLTIEDNLLLGAVKRGTKATIETIYAQFPRLKERYRQLAGTLSGGEQQMLAIGRAMMGNPRLLILDEPSLGLSPKLVEEMFMLIQSLNKTGLTILLVEQNVNQTLEIADKGFVLHEGVVTLQGKAQDLKHNPELIKTYLGG